MAHSYDDFCQLRGFSCLHPVPLRRFQSNESVFGMYAELGQLSYELEIKIEF